MLDALGPVIAKSHPEDAVEGLAAHGATAYASTWELSGDRPIRVLRRLVDSAGVDRGKVGAVAAGK